MLKSFDTYPEMVKHYLGDLHYFLINLMLLIDMFFSNMVYLYLILQIFIKIMSHRYIYFSFSQISFIIVIIASCCFFLSFLPVQKISLFSYLGIIIIILLQPISRKEYPNG